MANEHEDIDINELGTDPKLSLPNPPPEVPLKDGVGDGSANDTGTTGQRQG